MKKACRNGIVVVILIGMTMSASAATVRVTGGTWYLGNKLAASDFILNSAATLAGNGEIRAPATIAGTVSPGSSAADIGALSFSGLVAFESGTFVCHAASATSLDKISAGGNVNGNAAVQMTRAAGVAPFRQVIIAGGAASIYSSFTVSPSTEWALGQAGALDLIVSLGQLPPVPQNLAASGGRYSSRVALTWSASSGASGYQVWRNTVNNSSSAGMLGTTTQTSYNDNGSMPGTTCYYWVKATNNIGASAFSSSASGWRAGVCSDYDGDGKADLAVFRDGYWSIFSLVNGVILANVGEWGGPGWIPVPGDYDGDGAADLAVYRNGYWSIFSLVNGVILANVGEWGGAGWEPVSGDYDGDGKSDLAVYRNGYWSIFSLVNGVILANTGEWGGAGWTAVPGDYDGDGKADLAVYRDGYWSIFSLVNGVILANTGEWGGAGWTPVPGDYDGDGVADLAVYRDGYWSIFSLVNGVILANTGEWGGAGWTPVPGDYDGDGVADLAVYRDGYWSIFSLVNGVILANAGEWGGAGWTPVR